MLSHGWKIEEPYRPDYPVKRWIVSKTGHLWQERIVQRLPQKTKDAGHEHAGT